MEKCFVKHKDSQNVLDDTVEEFFNNNYLVPFPCAIHKQDMVEFIFTSYRYFNENETICIHVQSQNKKH